MAGAIRSVAGVRTADVSFIDENARVQSDTCSEQTFQQISAALHAQGYGGTVTQVVAK